MKCCLLRRRTSKRRVSRDYVVTCLRPAMTWCSCKENCRSTIPHDQLMCWTTGTAGILWPFRPQDRLPQVVTGKRKREEIHQCYLCESEWPENLDWPPPRKRKNGTLITIEHEPEENESQISDRTRRKTLFLNNLRL